MPPAVGADRHGDRLYCSAWPALADSLIRPRKSRCAMVRGMSTESPGSALWQDSRAGGIRASPTPAQPPATPQPCPSRHPCHPRPLTTRRTSSTVSRLIRSRDNTPSSRDNSLASPAIYSRSRSAPPRATASPTSIASNNDGTTPPASPNVRPHDGLDTDDTGSPPGQPHRHARENTPTRHPHKICTHRSCWGQARWLRSYAGMGVLVRCPVRWSSPGVGGTSACARGPRRHDVTEISAKSMVIRTSSGTERPSSPIGTT